jgi:tetratricopeptide (TPR) repeat protein
MKAGGTRKKGPIGRGRFALIDGFCFASHRTARTRAGLMLLIAAACLSCGGGSGVSVRPSTPAAGPSPEAVRKLRRDLGLPPSYSDQLEQAERSDEAKRAGVDPNWLQNLFTPPKSALAPLKGVPSENHTGYYLRGYYKQGMEAERTGLFDIAAAAYKHVEPFDRNYADALNRLGIIEMTKGENEHAVEHFRQASGLRPRDASMHRNLSEALQKAGQIEESAQELAEAERLEHEASQSTNHLIRIPAAK